jgi:uncharacterized membrane protein YfcA
MPLAVLCCAVLCSGGGGILVPIFILVMGFNPKYAIPLSNVTILGGSIMNMVMNVSKRCCLCSPRTHAH